jgi:hypothetical protein
VSTNPEWLPSDSVSKTAKVHRAAVVKQDTWEEKLDRGEPTAINEGNQCERRGKWNCRECNPAVMMLNEAQLAEAARPSTQVWACYAMDKPDATTRHQSVATHQKNSAWNVSARKGNQSFNAFVKLTY